MMLLLQKPEVLYALPEDCLAACFYMHQASARKYHIDVVLAAGARGVVCLA